MGKFGHTMLIHCTIKNGLYVCTSELNQGSTIERLNHLIMGETAESQKY